MSLDAAGTLITVAEPVGVTYARLAAAHGIEVSPAQLGEGFRAVYPRMPPLAFEGLAGDALVAAERDWWRMLVARVFGEAAATAPGFEPFFAAVYAHYAAADAWRVYPEVRAVLAELRARGLRLVVTSNFDTRLHGILAGLDLRVAFEAVVCSSEAGAAKPDAHVFAVACAAIEVDTAHALHVGDDRRADFDGARAAGLQALLVERGAATAPAAGRISSLAELPDLLA